MGFVGKRGLDHASGALDMAAQQAAGVVGAAFGGGLADAAMLALDRAVDGVVLEEEAAVAVAEVVQRRAEIQQQRHAAGREQALVEGAVRLLIRVDGDTEVVHVLGRKTTVGRTPDNDLQIDAKFISRNHAVILAGPNHTIIEDLNSTNGVAVNGKRITRHTLRDGDNLAIGKTTFRFAVRPART